MKHRRIEFHLATVKTFPCFKRRLRCKMADFKNTCVSEIGLPLHVEQILSSLLHMTIFCVDPINQAIK